MRDGASPGHSAVSRESGELSSRPPFICLVPPKQQNVTGFAKIGRRGRKGGDVLGSLTTRLSPQNEWTEAVDTDGRGGAAGADGGGGRGRQRTQARWERSNL